MGMNEQCKFCIHSSVCAYKEHYEDAVKLYEKARAECGKYPWFKCKIECVQYRKEDIQFIKRIDGIKDILAGSEDKCE